MYILKTATAVTLIAFAATGVAQARTKYHNNNVRPAYADSVYSQAPRELWPWNVPTQGVRGLACDMPDSVCSNSERIN
jgi:hypothetical protein